MLSGGRLGMISTQVGTAQYYFLFVEVQLVSGSEEKTSLFSMKIGCFYSNLTPTGIKKVGAIF